MHRVQKLVLPECSTCLKLAVTGLIIIFEQLAKYARRNRSRLLVPRITLFHPWCGAIQFSFTSSKSNLMTA